MDWLDRLPPATLNEGGWRAWTDYGVEVETAAFLYSLIRLTRPASVVESGAGEGFSAVAIASALADNRHGALTTFEPDARYQTITFERLQGLPAAVASGLSCDAPWKSLPDVVFLDSFGTHRPREIAFWAPKPVTLIVHDAIEHREHLQGGTFLNTPRGLWLRS